MSKVWAHVLEYVRQELVNARFFPSSSVGEAGSYEEGWGEADEEEFVLDFTACAGAAWSCVQEECEFDGGCSF